MAEESPLRINLMGGFALCRAGSPIHLPTRKAGAVLAVLALRAGQPVARESLIDMLWPDSPPEQGRASLRQALAQLRKTLDIGDSSLIRSTGQTLVLDETAVDVDAVALTQALATGDDAGLAEAARWYSGPFLQGFSPGGPGFDDWVRSEAARLQRLTLDGLGRLLDHYVAQSDVEAARDLAEHLLRIDPTDERICQALMRMHLNNGALGAAVREYERCRSSLATHLGVPPSADTEALRRQIWAAAPERRLESEAPPTVAVLPFANLSPSPQDELLVHGFDADLVHELARFRALRVVAAHSAYLAASMAASPIEAGRRLGAQYLVTGSVRRGPTHLRIAVDVADTRNGLCLWSHRDDVAAEALFDAQAEIARQIAAAMAVRIDHERLHQAARKPLESLETYECWLRGVACLRQGTAESHTEARRFFHRALEKDPGFARAYSGLSLTHFNEWSCLAWDRWADNERNAFEFAQRGLALDDTDHMTHFVLGRILLYRREFERARRHLERAEALNPNEADMLAQMALSDACLGEAARGIERSRLAMRLNPFHDDWYFLFAATAPALSGQLEAAIALCLKAPYLATDAHAWLAACHGHLGNASEARRHLCVFHHVFRQRITHGREPSIDEPARWIARVNPLSRPQDIEFLFDGLGRAGLAVPDDVAADTA